MFLLKEEDDSFFNINENTELIKRLNKLIDKTTLKKVIENLSIYYEYKFNPKKGEKSLIIKELDEDFKEYSPEQIYDKLIIIFYNIGKDIMDYFDKHN